ncbi:radical SAM protein [Ruminococcus flavefaciens]|uniref:radical SAM protein n=1 Tax=Ruminococcus flavefaciens TaxID=1265 RepID=UPI000685C93B|nr:radical SAM protein [Ruminococcus flavefaciens]
MERISLIKKHLPNVAVITMYARTDNIAHKSDEDLKQLKEAGVSDLYIGVESGDDVVLKRINKGYTAAQAREVLEKIDASGLPYIVNFLNGAGGHGYGIENAHRTAQLYDGLHMTMVNTSMMTVVPGTPLYRARLSISSCSFCFHEVP